MVISNEKEAFYLKKKKDEITILSSAAEYLTYVASVGDQQDSIEMWYEDENIWLHRRWWPHCTMLMFVQSMSILRKFIPTHSLRKRQLYGRDCQGKSRTRNGNQGRTGKAKRKEEPYGRFSNRSQEIGSKSRKRNEAVGGFNGRTRKRFGWKTSKDFQTPANGRRRKIGIIMMLFASILTMLGLSDKKKKA